MSSADPGAPASQRRFHIERWCDPGLPQGLAELLDEAMGTDAAWMVDFGREWKVRPFQAEGEALFVAFDQQTPVAMAVISGDPFVPGTETGRLRYIYVALAARGNGLARVLLEACLDRGQSRWRRLRLHTDNPIAARLYTRYGFGPTEGEARTTHARDADAGFNESRRAPKDASVCQTV